MLTHTDYMQLALVCAAKGRLTAPPNPWVGCVIVKDHNIVGQGHTQPPGQWHAEICALKAAGKAAENATMYVTLEPCAHFGKTPPCIHALIEAKIAKVFVALQDPDRRVSGKGIQLLRQAGIEVEIGLCAKEAHLSLTPYLYQRQTGLPYTIIKWAMSIDGRTAAADGTSQWITSHDARQDVHAQRAASQAIIIGAGTAIHDKPSLTVRHSNIQLKQQPLRVVLDATGKVPARGPLFDRDLAPTLVITTSQCPANRLQEWQACGVEVALVSTSTAGVDLDEVWRLLGMRGILQAFVEGGAHLHTQLLKTTLVNQLSFYIGPLLLGSSGLPVYVNEVATLSAAPRFALQSIKQIGECARLDYTVNFSA